MTRVDDELDEYGKHVLAPLRAAPPMGLPLAEQEKARFMNLGAKLQQDLSPQSSGIDQYNDHPALRSTRVRQPLPLLKFLVATLLALVVLVGSSITVYAAQNSLPGEPLYVIKSWSEDIRLSITSSPKARLDLTLDYTNRRMGEITSLLATGKVLPPQTSERFQVELENALLLAAQMDDKQMQNALKKIRHLAESQGMTIEELVTILPEQAEPAIAHLQQRLQEQVTLSSIGEYDPQAFRSEIRGRQRLHPGTHKSTPASDNSGTPLPTGNGNGHGNGNHQPSEVPGHSGNGPGQGKSTPDKENQGP